MNCDCTVCRRQRREYGELREKVRHTHIIVYGRGIDAKRRISEKCVCSYGDADATNRGTHVERWVKDGVSFVLVHQHCRCYKCRKAFIARRVKDSPPEQVALRHFKKFLTKRQRYTLDAHGYVDIVASDGSKWRMDCQGYSGNCYRIMGDGEALAQWASAFRTGWLGICVVVRQSANVPAVPAHDLYLAQLLMLTTDVQKFLDIGEVSGHYSEELVKSYPILIPPWKNPFPEGEGGARGPWVLPQKSIVREINDANNMARAVRAARTNTPDTDTPDTYGWWGD